MEYRGPCFDRTQTLASSARCKRPWNPGLLIYEIRTIYLHRFLPTYTTKCPFGTSSGSLCSLPYPFFFPNLVHRFMICLINSLCDILFQSPMPIFGETNDIEYELEKYEGGYIIYREFRYYLDVRGQKLNCQVWDTFLSYYFRKRS